MDASEIRSNETAARDARPGRWPVLLFAAGNGLLVLTFAVSGLGVASSPDFGWKQRIAVVVGVGIALVGLAWLCANRARSSETTPERPRLVVAAAQLLGLTALAIAQPLFDLLADNAEFFTARGSGGLDVAVFTVLLALVPPLALLGIEVLVGLVSEPARRVVHLVFVATLAGLLVLNAISDHDRVPGGLLLLLAAYVGIVVAAAVWATRGAAMLATVLAPAALLFPLLFVTSQSISTVFAHETVGRGAASSQNVPVVMVVFDEFPSNLLLGRDGRIDARRFPNFARLAGTSTWYPNATAVSDETSAAVPAIMTGQAPTGFAAPTSAGHPDNLFSLLARTHRMNVHEEVTRVCAEKICGDNREAFGSRMRSVLSDSWVVYRRLELPPSLRRGLPDISQGWKDFGADAAQKAPDAADLQRAESSDRVGLFQTFLRSLKSGGDKPALNFDHVLLPHVPWTYLPSGRAYYNSSYFPGFSLKNGHIVGSAARFSASQRMLLQTRLVDRLVGELVQRLQTTGLLDKAVVVIVADHGASVRPNESRRRITPGNSGEIAPVPLIVKAPGQHKAAIVKAHVRTIDVLPTIADLLGVRVPWKVDGRSLRTKAYPEPSQLTLFRVGAGGKQVSVPVSTFERTRAAALARQWRWFGVGNPFPGLAGPGHYDALLGKPVARVSGPEPGPRLVLDNPQRFKRVDLEGGPVPAFITGRASGLRPGDTRDVAIAVNGRVAAVGRTFEADGGQAFAIFVPDDALRQGRNDVRAYQVVGTGEAARLLAEG